MPSLYDFSLPDSAGGQFDFSSLKGKVVLIVNVASRCGYTSSNYAEFPKLREQFPADKFEIVLVPCSQFGDQELKKIDEVCEFAKGKGFAGKITAHTDVNGAGEAPLFKWLKEQSGDLTPIKWNFGKFLVSKDGQSVKRYSHSTSPLSIVNDISAFVSA